jgi:hypothetical protein
MVAEESADASALRRVFRSAVPSADPARVADEVEQCLVDLVGVGPDDRVRPARDDDAAGVDQQRGSLLPVAS